jgi:hypothetical protein
MGGSLLCQTRQIEDVAINYSKDKEELPTQFKIVHPPPMVMEPALFACPYERF